MGLPLRHTMSLDDFLRWEAEQSQRHEFIDGEVHAMTGGTTAHNQVAMNLAYVLMAALDATPCRVALADVKLQAANLGNFYHPDVMVTCAARDVADDVDPRAYYEQPTLLVEVLSPSTARRDRLHKLTAYRSIASVRGVILIDPKTRVSEVWSRAAPSGEWSGRSVGADEPLPIECFELTVEPRRLWAKVERGAAR